tara:strand:+ start:6191 stop:7027 length:837 start_codon:yes stop_codon:yes gene_type:complete
MLILFYILQYLNTRESFIDALSDAVIYEKKMMALNPRVVYNTHSQYQDISVIKFDKNNIGFDKCLMLGDEVQLCDGNEYKYHETITHVAASYIKNIRNVLIIGGGDCMTLREIMKYPSIQHVVMLELDKKVIDVSKKYFNSNDYQDDPRVEIIIGDATKNIDKIKKKFELVIIDTTEDSSNNSPIDSKEFLKKTFSKVNVNGILVKNGDDMKNFINISSLANNVKIIKYDEYIWGETDYRFIVASNYINFDESTRYKHDIDLKFYHFNKHENFIFNTD